MCVNSPWYHDFHRYRHLPIRIQQTWFQQNKGVLNQAQEHQYCIFHTVLPQSKHYGAGSPNHVFLGIDCIGIDIGHEPY